LLTSTPTMRQAKSPAEVSSFSIDQICTGWPFPDAWDRARQVERLKIVALGATGDK
jgi:hypothetical protein